MNSLTGAARYFNQVIGPGQTLPVLAAGTQFYFTAASGPLFVKPSAGSYSLYYSAMGDVVPAGFSLLSLYNPTANAVTFGLIVSFSEVIDKRQLPSTQTPNIVHLPILVSDGSGNLVADIPDLSGQQFMDQVGTPWLAIQRVSITAQILADAEIANSGTVGVLNLGVGPLAVDINTVIIQLQGGNNMPASTIQNIQIAGLLSVYTSVLAGYFSIFEIYQAIAPNSQAYQPPN